MKSFITPSYVFTPGESGVGKVNLSGIEPFDIKRLVAIINQTRGVLIYSTASEALRFTSVSGKEVTLFFDTSEMNSADVLQVIYELPNDYSTLAKQDVLIDRIGDKTDNQATGPIENGSVIAVLKGIRRHVYDSDWRLRELETQALGGIVSEESANVGTSGHLFEKLPLARRMIIYNNLDPNNADRVRWGKADLEVDWSEGKGAIMMPGQSSVLLPASSIRVKSETGTANVTVIYFP